MKKLILLTGILALLSSCGPTASGIAATVMAPPSLLLLAPSLIKDSIKEKINGETDYIDSSIGVFEYKNAKISQQNGIVIINGTLLYKSSPENTTQNVTLTIPCYDSEHNEIGNAIAKTRISKKGDPTPFRATIKSDKVRFCALEYGTISGE